MVALVAALVVGVSGAEPAIATPVPQTYATPGTYTFNVPSGVSHLRMEVFGAQGGKGHGGVGGAGAKGGEAVLVRAVTAGQTFQVRVGARAPMPQSRWRCRRGQRGRGGGDGGSFGSGGGGGGGGASDVRGPNCDSSCGLSSRLVVGAGGGGGRGQGGPHPNDPRQQGYDGAPGGPGAGPPSDCGRRKSGRTGGTGGTATEVAEGAVEPATTVGPATTWASTGSAEVAEAVAVAMPWAAS